MKTKFLITLVLLLSNFFTYSQTTPHEMVQRMGRGINLGNVMSAPIEGNWSAPVTEQYFQDVADAGFTLVRIPIRFETYTDVIFPYTVQSTYLDRVEQVTDWALAKGLVAIIDVHGDKWFWESYSDADPATPTQETYDRFMSIWKHISERFQNKSEDLLFEIMNEPFFDMSAAEVDAVNMDVLDIIRLTNPTRNVIITGGGKNSYEAPLQISPTVIASDDHLIATFHYYWPRVFTASASEQHNQYTWGTIQEKLDVDTNFDFVKAWSEQYDIPIFLGEFGADNEGGLNYETGVYGSFGGPEQASRVEYYRYLMEAGINRGFASAAWCAGPSSGKSIHLRDDNGTNVIPGTWVADIKDALVNAGTWPAPAVIDNNINNQYNWTFNTTNPLLNWQEANCIISVSSGAVTMTFDGGNTPKLTTTGLSFKAADYPEIEVIVRNNTSIDNVNGSNTSQSMRIVTTNSNDSTYFKVFDHSASDIDFQTYVIDLSKGAKYKGTIVEVEFQGIRGGVAGSVDIDNIRMVRANAIWTGSIDSDWTNTGNWSGSTVPRAATDVIIPIVTNAPEIISTNPEVADIDLEEGAQLSITSGNTLTINGDLNATTGKLLVQSGASLITNGNVSGNLHEFSRNTSFGVTTGRYSVIGSPVLNATTSVLGTQVYAYDETISYGTDGSNRFKQIISPEIMSPGNGYFSAYTGEVVFTGTPNTGIVAIDLEYDALDGQYAGFNLVANPYPCAIDFSIFVGANPNIDGTVYLWDDGGSDISQRTNADYITINNAGVVSNGSTRSADWNGNIGSTQGFIVKAKNANQMYFTPSMRVSGQNEDDAFFRKTAENEDSHVRLFTIGVDELKSETLIVFREDATLAFDRLLDAVKVSGHRLYSKSNGYNLAIQSLPMPQGEITIPIEVATIPRQFYELGLDDQSNIPDGYNTYIQFSDQAKWYDLKEENLNFQASDVLANFNLILTKSTILTNVVKPVSLVVKKDGILISSALFTQSKAMLTITDISGRLLLSKELDPDESQIAFEFESGKIYFIRFDSFTYHQSLKVVLK